jgi:putative flippase GtrA
MDLKIIRRKDKYFEYSILRWVAVGASTTIVDYLIFIALYGVVTSVFVANLFSASASTSLNYYAHHKWTFKSNQNHSRSGFKYALNLIFWWLVSTSIIKALILLDVDPKIAKLAPLLVIAPINYFVLNKIVFNNKLKNLFV